MGQVKEGVFTLQIKDLLVETEVRMSAKRALFFIVVVVSLMLYPPVREYLYWTFKSPYYTHAVLIPVVSAVLIFRQRKAIFADSGYAVPAGLILALGGAMSFAGATMVSSVWIKQDVYALTAFATVLVVIGAFIMFFGTMAFLQARFALYLLLFMIPLPSVIERSVIGVLQQGSAEFAGLLFSVTGSPVLREGVSFQLPGVSIEVAPECSGIRSSLALLITAVLAGHMYLKTAWNKIVLVLFVLPVTMFKNAIRIVTLSLLGVYVNRDFLESSLHREGGIIFFAFALLLMTPVLFVLRKRDMRVQD